MGSIKIILANGSELVKTGLRTIISEQPSMQVIAEFSDSEKLLEFLSGRDVDLVIIDQTSYGFSVDDISRIRTRSGKVKCLAITPEQSAQALMSAIKAGVTGYVKTDCSNDEILEAIQETSKNRKFFCGQILEVIRSSALEFGDVMIGELTCDPIVLSDRELEVIRMIAEGLTNSQIADSLFLSAHTVNAHRRNVMQKLGVNNTAAVVMYAVKAGLVSPNKYLFSPEAQA